MKKKVAFTAITSTKTYGPQKLVSLSFVKGSHQILVIGSYAVADFKITDVRKLMMKHTSNHDYKMSKNIDLNKPQCVYSS